MDLLDRLRDLIVLAAVPGAGASGLLDASEDQIERMRKQAAEFGSDRLAMAAETISNGLVEMRGATSPRLLLELMCAQVLLPGSAAPDRTASESEVGDLAARIERLERQLAAGGSAGRDDRARPPAGRDVRTQAPAQGLPAAGPAGARTPAPPTPAPSPAAAPAQGNQPARPSGGGTGAGLSADELRSRWPDVLEAVRDVRKTAWILLSNYASIDTVEGNVLTMAFDSEGNAKGFASSGSDGYLAAVIDRMFGVRPVVRAIVNPAGGAGGGRGSAPERASGGGKEDHRRGDAAADQGGSDAGRAGSAATRRGSPPGDRSDDGGQPASHGRVSASGRGAGGRVDASGQAGTGGQPPEDAPAKRPAKAAASAGGRQAPAGAKQASAGGRGPASAGARGGQYTAPDLADDPRPLTDAVPEGGPDSTGRTGTDLTGTDLIMRELGGRMIEET